MSLTSASLPDFPLGLFLSAGIPGISPGRSGLGADLTEVTPE